MNIYHYDSQFCFVTTTQARLDPLETLHAGHDVFLVPAMSTTIPVPDVTLGQYDNFKFENDSWVLIKDYRGLIVYDENNEEVVITSIGELPPNCTLERKP